MTFALVMTTVAESHPPAHAKYFVKRDGQLFTAIPCYRHMPWWVVQHLDGTEGPPVPMCDTDEWCREVSVQP